MRFLGKHFNRIILTDNTEGNTINTDNTDYENIFKRKNKHISRDSRSI